MSTQCTNESSHPYLKTTQTQLEQSPHLKLKPTIASTHDGSDASGVNHPSPQRRVRCINKKRLSDPDAFHGCVCVSGCVRVLTLQRTQAHTRTHKYTRLFRLLTIQRALYLVRSFNKIKTFVSHSDLLGNHPDVLTAQTASEQIRLRECTGTITRHFLFFDWNQTYFNR